MDMSPVTHCSVSWIVVLVALSIFVWPLLEPIARRRGADLRAFSLGSFVIGMLGAALGQLQVLQREQLSGSHGAAIAAGLAEALIPALLGTVVTAVVAMVIAIAPQRSEARRRRSPGVEALMVMSGAALTFISWPGMRAFSRWMIAVSSVLVIAVAIFSIVPARTVQPRSGRFGFIGIALASFAGSFVLWRLIDHYRAIALGVAAIRVR